MRSRILLIEDDLGLAIPLKDFFEDNGLEVLHAETGEGGLQLYHAKQPDLIILDIILPNKNGFEVISEIRDKDMRTPIILMTGTEFSPESQIKGYQLGAINFMPKPVLPQALLSLIKHVLMLPSDLKRYTVGGLSIRVHAQQVEIGDHKFKMRERDAALLELLLERKNQIVERSTLLKQVWFDDHPDKNNILDGAILRIRRIFKSYPSIHIKSVYGTGYSLECLSK